MAARSDSDEEDNEQQVINGVKGALERQKSQFQSKISNVHKLRDLDKTFQELDQFAEAIVKGKFGPLRHRHEHEITLVYPMLERIMIRAKNGINRRLTPQMSYLHPWIVRFDVPMPQEVFTLLHKGIVNRNRTSYGVDVLEKHGSVTMTFTNMRRLCVLFNQFEDCQGFTKELGDGQGVVKLIVDNEKHGTFKYKIKKEILQFNFHYGYWNAHGISQH